jgi:hypothetical protein
VQWFRLTWVYTHLLQLCLTLLVNSLLQGANSTAAIIDTTGHFDIVRLYMFVLARLQSDVSLVGSFRAHHASVDLSAEDIAAKVLDRVQIMRVFDLVGVAEAFDEILGELEGTNVMEETKEIIKGTSEKIGVEKEVPSERPASRKMVVADSEDEDEDEMLFDASSAHNLTISIANTPDPILKPKSSSTPRREHATYKSRLSFVLVDSVAHVVSLSLKKDYNQSKPYLRILVFGLY